MEGRYVDIPLAWFSGRRKQEKSAKDEESLNILTDASGKLISSTYRFVPH